MLVPLSACAHVCLCTGPEACAHVCLCSRPEAVIVAAFSCKTEMESQVCLSSPSRFPGLQPHASRGSVTALQLHGTQQSIYCEPILFATCQRSQSARFNPCLYISQHRMVHMQAIFALAREVDPSGQRTIGVLTKVDTIEEGTHDKWFNYLRGDGYKLKLVGLSHEANQGPRNPAHDKHAQQAHS
jgi:hypothetical protein